MRARLLTLGVLMFALALPAMAQERRGASSLDRVLPQVRQAVPGTFYDAEGPYFTPDGRATYRLKWMTPDGRIIWFNVDARTGQVLGGAQGGQPPSRYRDEADSRGNGWQRNNWGNDNQGGGWGNNDGGDGRGGWGNTGGSRGDQDNRGGRDNNRGNRGWGNGGDDGGDQDGWGNGGGNNKRGKRGGGWGNDGGGNDGGGQGGWGNGGGQGGNDQGSGKRRRRSSGD